MDSITNFGLKHAAFPTISRTQTVQNVLLRNVFLLHIYLTQGNYYQDQFASLQNIL